MAATDKPSKPFPIPVRVVGAGSQIEEDTLDYMVMPREMDTWRPPQLPEPEQLAGHQGAREALRRVADWLKVAGNGRSPGIVDLSELQAADRELINQVLGEGEVSARVVLVDGELQIQESVFAGVWRVVGAGRDLIEVGAAPAALLGDARPLSSVIDALETHPKVLPRGVMNAPAVIAELAEHLRRWQPGQGAQVINLTLLPLSPEDVSYLTGRLGSSGTEVLSRGYGNCRVSRSALACCWQLVYYNSQDQVILNTIEVTDLPDAVCAAAEDLADSAERLEETLSWLEQSA